MDEKVSGYHRRLFPLLLDLTAVAFVLVLAVVAVKYFNCAVKNCVWF